MKSYARTGSRRGRAIAFLAVLALLLCAIRIGWVNAKAEPLPVRVFQKNEEVPLEGDYMMSLEESTAGYSVCLQEAEHLSYEEMMRRYDMPADYLAERSQFDVLLLRLKITNTDSEGGFLFIREFRVLNRWGNMDYGIDKTLLSITEPTIGESSIIAIWPDTEYVLTLPYSLDKKSIDGQNEMDVKADSPYALRVSAYPVQKRIQFPIS